MIEVEYLRRERENPHAALQLFLLNDAKVPSGVHAFVEGHDDLSFYMNFIRISVADPDCVYPLYICGNKAGVYKAHHLIMKASPRGTTLFFVDKDLSDILGEQWAQACNIYVTDYYSIENYLVSDDMLSRVWTELFHFTHMIVSFNETCRNKFQAALEQLYQFMLHVTAWGIYLRQKGQRPNMKNVRFTKFFVFAEDLTLEKSAEARRVGDTKLFESVCGAPVTIDTQAEFDAIIAHLTLLPPKVYVYGKLELEFFVEFVKKLVEYLWGYISGLQINAGQERQGSVQVLTQLSERNAVEVLGPRVSMPVSLRQFLQENIHSQGASA